MVLFMDGLFSGSPGLVMATFVNYHWLWRLDFNYHRPAAIQCCSFFSPHRVCSIFYVDCGQRIIQDG